MKILLSRFYRQKPYDFIFHEDRFVDFLSTAKEFEFDGIEYTSTIPELFSNSKKILSLSSKYKIPVTSVHVPPHMVFYVPEISFKNLLTMYTTFSDAEAFNFHLSGFTNPIHRDDKHFKKFLTLVKKNNIPLTLESNPKMFGLQYYPKITWEPDLFANYCIRNGLAITFDTSHIAHWKYNIVTFFKKYHNHIKLIHLSDYARDTQHLPLGDGELPLLELFKELKRVNYNQLITLEIKKFPKDIMKEKKLEAIHKSISMVRKYTQ
jgi:sugar phosphate isomerase/epimerase